METRSKRAFIILVYIVILVLIVFGAYSLFKEKETCFDNIKNQNEEDADCGGICEKGCDKIEAQNLIVEKVGFAPSGIAGKYDFYARVFNPNAIFGNGKFNYRMDFKDSSGGILASKENAGFILPGERKYLIENNIDASSAPASADIKIKDSDWVQFNDYYKKPDIKIVNKNYSEISGGVGFSEAKGLLKNNSPFDFDLIKIQIILEDENGRILALNSTQMKTVKAGEERDFKISWPNRFSGIVSNMEVQAEVNVFNSDAFFKRFYQAHKFQEY